MFHLLIMIVVHGQLVPLTDIGVNNYFHNRDECYAIGRQTSLELRGMGIHGRYMCMYRHESEAGLAHETKVEF